MEQVNHMDRIDKIIEHPLFLYHLRQNQAAEAERRFCRHDMTHFLDVARIGVMISLEEGLKIPRDWIYAAALLHDMGKHIQYEDGTPHELAGGRIAPQILQDCGYDQKETTVITEAILKHREKSTAQEKNLSGILYRADKASRPCFACEAEPDCNWKADKKNRKIKY